MVVDKPKLLFQAKVERRPFFRRAAWWLLCAVAAAGATVALGYATPQVEDKRLLAIGQAVAVLVTLLAFLRAIFNLINGLRRTNETLRFFDKGFMWQRNKQQYKYKWDQIAKFREGVRALTFRGRPMLQRGAHSLTMRDGRVFKVRGIHGNTRQFARAVRPIVADVTGTNIGRALRSRKEVRLHSSLTMLPGGLRVGKVQIPWSELDVKVKGGKLHIYRLNNKRQFKRARSFDTHQIDNLGGFMEVATSTIRNHQPERFNIRTQGLDRG